MIFNSKNLSACSQITSIATAFINPLKIDREKMPARNPNLKISIIFIISYRKIPSNKLKHPTNNVTIDAVPTRSSILVGSSRT